MPIKKLGEYLIDQGLVTREQVDFALAEQAAGKGRIGEILVANGSLSEEKLLEVMAKRLKTPKITLDSLIIDPLVIAAVPVELARRHTLIPVFRIGRALTVAMADPLNIIAVDELAYTTNCDIRRAIASERAIKAAIERYYSVQQRLKSVIGDLQETPGNDRTRANEDDAEDAPVVRLVQIVLTKAVREGASDVHIEPDENTVRIRYRVHGRMREEASPPKTLQSEIISRVKIAASLDVSEKRAPQDGRFSIDVDDTMIDLRVSTLPTIHGEKIVIRILDPRKIRIGLTQLGFEEKILERWRNLIRTPEGLILISGPTSSGKTTTLYSSLMEINSIEQNIITVEDPVEYSLPLINQVQTNDRAGLTFAACLRSILRQNPDIIMVGEIRDQETAVMAVRSALTGHLVFSTIHTNDTASSVTRLIDMGVESFLVASALKGALAQRLVRLNCQECLHEYNPPATLVSLAGLPPDFMFKRSKGCPKCKMTGHSGMSAVYEYLPIDSDISGMIVAGESDFSIKQTAQHKGMKSLYDNGLILLRDGRITLEELLQIATPDKSRRREAEHVSLT